VGQAKERPLFSSGIQILDNDDDGGLVRVLPSRSSLHYKNFLNTQHQPFCTKPYIRAGFWASEQKHFATTDVTTCYSVTLVTCHCILTIELIRCFARALPRPPDEPGSLASVRLLVSLCVHHRPAKSSNQHNKSNLL